MVLIVMALTGISYEKPPFWLTDTAEQAVRNTLNNKERPKSVALFSSIYGSNFMYKNKV